MTEYLKPASAQELANYSQQFANDEQWLAHAHLVAVAALVAAIDRLQPAGRAEHISLLAQAHADQVAEADRSRELFLEAHRESEHLRGELRSRDLEIEALKGELARIKAALAVGSV